MHDVEKVTLKVIPVKRSPSSLHSRDIVSDFFSSDDISTILKAKKELEKELPDFSKFEGKRLVFVNE